MDRFLIASQNVGLETDVKPFLLPETAYAQLGNAYIFRGRIRKRFGSRYMIPSTPPVVGNEQTGSRLRINIGTTDPGTGNFTTTVPGSKFKIGQMFSIGATLFTVVVANGAMLTTGASTGTYNTATGVVTIVGNGVNPSTAVYFYPAEPVMGIFIYQSGPINDQPTIVFDTQFAYQFATSGWERLAGEGDVGAATWKGSDSQFFWATTFQGVNANQKYFYVTNFNASEPMRYFDGSKWWNFQPTFTDTDGVTTTIKTCRIIVPYKGRLHLQNTVEDNSSLGNGLSFLNRDRYSVIGSPIDNAGSLYFAYLDDTDSANYKGAGFVDNTQTQEAIISGEFLKDRWINYYERSVYELAYTSNEIFPFRWQQINTELGAQSTFSTVPFDREVLAIGQTGIHSCTGANVQRIDSKIPNEIFKIQQQNDGVLRVQGIRDYFVEQVYWIMPLTDQVDLISNKFPNRVLVYNYVTQSWAYNSDSFTALGYFNQQSNLTWGTATMTWGDASFTWGSGTNQSNFRQVLAGNQEGYLLILDSNIDRNAGALQITNITIPSANVVQLTIVDHNLTAYDSLTQSPTIIYIENVDGSGLMASLNNACFQITSIVDKDTIQIAAFPMDPLTDIYAGAGTVARVSNINIVSKQWNPYGKVGQNFTINKIDFLVDRTATGELSIDYFNSTSTASAMNNTVPGVNTGNFTLSTAPYSLYPLEQQQAQLWHTYYLSSVGTYIQIRLFMNDNQMLNPNISLSPFVLHGLILYTARAGRLQ